VTYAKWSDIKRAKGVPDERDPLTPAERMTYDYAQRPNPYAERLRRTDRDGYATENVVPLTPDEAEAMDALWIWVRKALHPNEPSVAHLEAMLGAERNAYRSLLACDDIVEEQRDEAIARLRKYDPVAADEIIRWA
jgi:hypothetical protein